MKISVIIPTLNAEHELPMLLNALHEQDEIIHEIMIVDSASEDKTAEICKKDPSIKLIEIERKDFDHGKTRDMALRKCEGEVIVFLTQDAVPANKSFLKNLIAPLAKDKVVVSTGRQLPKKDARQVEKLIRKFNYPSISQIKSKEDLPKMGIKTFFCSDVCAAYRRDAYLELGGFDFPLKTNEDMFFAAKVINAGYCIAYAADAMVYHSHNFTLKEQYDRNYVQGYEIEKHREELHNVILEVEGINLVKYVSKELLKKGHIFSFFYFGFECFARFLGSRAGKRAAKIYVEGSLNE